MSIYASPVHSIDSSSNCQNADKPRLFSALCREQLKCTSSCSNFCQSRKIT